MTTTGGRAENGQLMMRRWLYRNRSVHAITHALARRLRTDLPAVLLTTKDADHSPPTGDAPTRVEDVRGPADGAPVIPDQAAAQNAELDISAAWLPDADIEITGTLPEAAESYATERDVAKRSC